MTAMVWWMALRARCQRWLDATVNPRPPAGPVVHHTASRPFVRVVPLPYDWSREEVLG